jgi:hypothetical protein
MALPAPPKQLRVRLPENERVARCLHEKRLSVGGLKVNLDRTFAKAYGNVCASEEPIRTLKEFSKIKYPSFPFFLFHRSCGRFDFRIFLPLKTV